MSAGGSTPAASVRRSTTVQSLAHEHWIVALLIAMPVLFNAVLLWPEVWTQAPFRNDLTLHWRMIKSASDALAQDHTPLDFWMPQLSMGFPQFLYYQNLPHLVLVGVHRALFGTVELLTLFNASRWLLLVTLPLTMYWSMRQLGFSMRAAAVSAAGVSLVSAEAGFGLEYEGQLWLGRGLYTQLWAEHLFLIALACTYRLLRTGTGYATTIVILAMLALTHFIWAYMSAVGGVMMWIVASSRRTALANGVRLALVGALAVAIASYMLWPFLDSSDQYLSALPGVETREYTPMRPLMRMLRGELLDQARWPVLSLLVVLGAAITVRRHDRLGGFALLGALAWLALHIFRMDDSAFLVRVLRLDSYVTYRFIGALDIFLLMLVGIAGEWLWQLVADRRWGRSADTASSVATAGAPARAQMLRTALVPLLLLVVLAPAIRQRHATYRANTTAIRDTEQALAADTDLKTVLQRLDAEPEGGRVYAGLSTNWGQRLAVGSHAAVFDVIKNRDRDVLAPPYQGLSLNVGMVFGFPDAVPAFWNLLDVRYAITPTGGTPPAFLQPLLTTSRYTLYRVTTSGSAMYGAVAERHAIGSSFDLLRGIEAWSRGPGPESGQFVRWDYMTPSVAHTPTAPCPDGGRTLRDDRDLDRVTLEVECPAAATLIIKTSYHPNWRVTVNGRDTRPYMVSPSFLAVDLPAGRHTVVATYTMSDTKRALLFVGIAVLLITLVVRDRFDWLPRRLGGGVGVS